MAVFIEGLGKVLQALKLRTPSGSKEGTMKVSYGGEEAPYAIYVHEDLTKFHPHGNAKFLERPFRMMRDQMADSIAKDMKNRRGIKKALINAANVLLRESIPQVPVDTGALRDSHLLEYSEKKL